jgi:hypothetical protein
MAIVSEIQAAAKPLIASLTSHTQLDYEYSLHLNSDRGYTKKFGFIPLGADFVNGRSQGFTTIDHTFQCILTDDYMNKDDDTSQNTIVMELYGKAQNLLKELQKSKLALPTPTNKVLLIAGLNIEEPEFSGDNSTVALRINFNIQYRYQNN